MEYGCINEDGYLRIKDLNPVVVKYWDAEKEVMKERVVSVEEQLLELGNEWKPVDFIDGSKLVSEDDSFSIHPVPYDNGDRISYRYDKVFNNAKIKDLIYDLSSEDYKIIKCYEASLIGSELPYDIHELHEKRQKLRDKINTLQETKAKMKNI